jgi:hypothetical protein
MTYGDFLVKYNLQHSPDTFIIWLYASFYGELK